LFPRKKEKPPELGLKKTNSKNRDGKKYRKREYKATGTRPRFSSVPP